MLSSGSLWKLSRCAACSLGLLLLVGPVAAQCPAQEPAPVNAPLVSDPAVEKLLEPIRTARQVPGLIAGIIESTGLKTIGAVGVRKLGAEAPLTVNDKCHIGSDTKAMTATHLAQLVEQGKLTWDSTLAEIFPQWQAEFHPEFRPVTVRQLLSHRAGIADDFSFWQVGTGPVTEQRETLLKRILAKPPAYPPGSKFQYSNFGYIFAGHVAEQVTGKPWEEQITTDLFAKLEMTSVGFGFPGTKDGLDQPWGHAQPPGKVLPTQFDNPPVLGPAGRVHCTPADWARFLTLHLNGAIGKPRLLTRETFQTLHTPVGEGSEYAGGWMVVPRPWAGGNVLIHSGSNTLWYATAVIAPHKERAWFAITNIGGTSGQTACDEALAALIRQALDTKP